MKPRPERNTGATFALLAYHWNQAGVEEKARLYQEKAGDHALKNGAYQEAAEFFQAVVDRLLSRPRLRELDSAERLHRASLHRRLAASLMGLGRLEDSREECLLALKWIGEATPIRPASCLPRLLCANREAGLASAAKRPAAKAFQSSRFSGKLAAFWNSLRKSITWATIRCGFCTPACGCSIWRNRPARLPELARAFAAMGLTAATIPCRTLAESYMRQARETVEQVEHLPSSAWVSLTTGIYHVGIANWEIARDNLIAGHGPLSGNWATIGTYGSTSTVLGGSYYFAGNFREGIPHLVRTSRAFATPG